jgi:cytoskeleton protein RodZ
MRMDEVGQAAPAAERAGDVLRAARERLGLSVADVAERTRVPQRHLEAIEAADYSSLPSPTYATGFSRAYARAVGADEVAIARNVRDELERSGRRKPEYQPFEVADPARVPSRGLTVVALGLALAVAILAGLWFGTDLLRGGTGTTVVAAPPVAGPAPVVSQPVAPATPSGGEVVLTAIGEVWMQVRDGERTLYTGTLKQGERFVLPRDAQAPRLNVGRPDQLRITVNGAAVPPLGDGSRPLSNVAIDGAAMVARASGAPAGAAPAAAPTARTPQPAAGASGNQAELAPFP